MRRLVGLAAIGLLVLPSCSLGGGEATPEPVAKPAIAPSAVPVTPVDPGPTSTPEDGPTEDGGPRRASRVIGGLDNVENSVFALGSVWAATSNLPDEFSSGPIEAGVVRIDPSTGETETVLASPGVEPTFAVTGDRLWVRLADRLAALDRSGTEVASVPLELGRSDDLTAAGGLLWVGVSEQRQVLGIDPATGTIVATVDSLRFPGRPVSAFGLVWIPDLIDGTMSIIDPEAGADAPAATVFVTESPKNVMPVPGATTGDEVWVTNTDGAISALSAERGDLGRVRPVPVDRPINRIVVQDDRAFLLPTWGRSVLVLDLETEEPVAEIPIDSIPVRALVAHGLIWVTGDGDREVLTAIDPDSLVVLDRFEAGSGASMTTGPQQPLEVDDEVWVPNRGDDAFFVVATDEL